MHRPGSYRKFFSELVTLEIGPFAYEFGSTNACCARTEGDADVAEDRFSDEGEFAPERASADEALGGAGYLQPAARGGQGAAELSAARWASVCQWAAASGTCAEQGVEGFRCEVEDDGGV